MATVRCVSAQASGVSQFSFQTNVYLFLFGNGLIGSSAAEGTQKVRWRVAGTLANLYVRAIANTFDGTTTVKSRKNGADGNMSVSISSSTTGFFEDTGNTDTIASGDDLDYLSTLSGVTTGSIKFTVFGSTFAASGNTTKKHGSGTSNFGINTTVYRPFCDSGNAANAEADIECKFSAAATLTNLFVNMALNQSANSITINLRKNGANGNMNISVSAGATGIFEDQTNTDSISVGDKVNYSTTVTDVSSNAGDIGVEETSTAGTAHTVNARDTTTQTGGTTKYFTWGGSTGTTTTESEAKHKARIATTVSNLKIKATTNAATGAHTLNFRKNGANGNQSASVTASTTGWFEDNTHSDAIVETDDVSLQLITDASADLTFGVVNTLMTTVTASDTQEWLGCYPIRKRIGTEMVGY